MSFCALSQGTKAVLKVLVNAVGFDQQAGCAVACTSRP